MNKKTRTWLILTVVAIGIAWVGFNIYQSSPVSQPPPPPPSLMTEADLLQNWDGMLKLACQPVRGNINAPWTMIECGDFQCPSCGKMRPVVEKVIEQSNGQCRMYFINFPLVSIHKNAQAAGDAAIAGEAQGKFWPMYDAIYTHQSALESIKPNDAKAALMAAARVAGLDMTKFTADASDPATDARLRSQGTFLNERHVSETPTVFLRHGTDNIVYVFQGSTPQPPKQSIVDMANNLPWKGHTLPAPSF